MLLSLKAFLPLACAFLADKIDDHGPDPCAVNSNLPNFGSYFNSEIEPGPKTPKAIATM
jgi:hypothetical protein